MEIIDGDSVHIYVECLFIENDRVCDRERKTQRASVCVCVCVRGVCISERDSFGVTIKKE
jgi:hypothetical protein